MKKTILLLSTLMFGLLNANAQYFHAAYGSDDDEQTNDGINLINNNGGDGHLMVGTNTTAFSGFEEIEIVVVEGAGNIIHEEQVLLDYMGGGVDSKGQQCIELPGTDNGFGIAADFDGVKNGVVYMTTSIGGMATVLSTLIELPQSYDVSIREFVLDDTPGSTDGYIVGEAVDNNTSNKELFACKFDVTTGFVHWRRIYTISTSTAAMYPSVYDCVLTASPHGLVAVGAIQNSPLASYDAAYYSIDPTSGTMLTAKVYSYPASPSNADEIFKTVIDDKNAANPSLFVSFDIGSSPMSYSTGFSRFDYAGNGGAFTSTSDHRIHSYVYSSPPPSISTQRCMDMKMSSTGEFYQLIEVTRGNVASPRNVDFAVLKFIPGTPLAQFSYGDYGDYVTCLDIKEGSPIGMFNGLSIFGASSLPSGVGVTSIGTSNDLRLLKVDFNGTVPMNGCVIDENFVSMFIQHPSDLNLLHGSGNPSTPVSINATSEPRLVGVYQCGPYIAPFNIPTEDPNNLNDIQISPNPMLPGVSNVSVQMESDVEEDVSVVVYDMMGRVVFNGQFHITKGKNNLSFELPIFNMAKGMYTLKVSGNTTNKTVRLLVE